MAASQAKQQPCIHEGTRCSSREEHDCFFQAKTTNNQSLNNEILMICIGSRCESKEKQK